MDQENQGLSRRDLLRKGAVTGAVVWATPLVTTIGMSPALAQAPSPVEQDISYIAINFMCEGDETLYYSKFDSGGWDGGVGQVESQCPGIDTTYGVDASDDPFDFPDADLSTGQVTPGDDCTLIKVALKSGQNCTFVPVP